jgi:uncharacterized membrane protein
MTLVNRLGAPLLICLTVLFGWQPVLAVSHNEAPSGYTANPEASESMLPYVTAKVLNRVSEEESTIAGTQARRTTFRALLTKGPASGQEVSFVQDDLFLSQQAMPVQPGDRVVLAPAIGPDGAMEYALIDLYRIPQLWWLAGLFFLLAVFFGRLRGLTAIGGLTASIAVIIGFIIPRILAGGNPFATSLIGLFAIATLSLFLAHGFTKRTGIAYVGTLLTLAISTLFSLWAVGFTRLFGTGTEDSLFVLSDFPQLSLQGLLLGGMMLGLLGVLDDITTAQSAVVDELKQANPNLPFRELYRRGLSVGREHIASLINTLVLAYTGASLPLFLLFYAYRGQALWTLFNNELIAEEIVRTLVGSAGLILAVPITTALAAYAFSQPSQEKGAPTRS